MYNIHQHYFNLYSFLKTIIAHPRLEYLYPFGASSVENLETIDTPNSPDVDPIIFCYDQEPLIPGYNDPLFLKVQLYSRMLKRPVILITTERDSDALNYFLNKYGFINCYGFFHIFAAHDWFRGYDYDSKLIPVTNRTIKKKFITFNRLTGSARVYRSLFVGELAKRNLIDHGHVSYSDTCPEHGHYHTTLDYAVTEYGVDPAYVDEIKQELDTLAHPMRIDYRERDSIPNHSMVLSAVDECMESFLYVVTETCYWERKCHLTEKIFKPIILRQPFVLLGCAFNLEYLKSYGFKTFDKWWSEGYDCITDPVKRLQAVSNVIESVSSKSEDELHAMLLEMESVLDHNYNLFNSKEFLDAAWGELTHNLQQAVNSAPVLQDAVSVRGTRLKSLPPPTDFVPRSLVNKVQ